jgi:hypothetical protein
MVKDDDLALANAALKPIMAQTGDGKGGKPSSGSGSSDGGKGSDDKSGSSGGGGKSGSSSSFSDDADKKKKLRLLLLAALLVGTIFVLGYGALILTALKTTTPEGREHVEKILAYDERNKERDHAEFMKKAEERAARLRAKNGQLPFPNEAARSQVIGSCISPGISTTKYSAPLFLQAGQCLKLEKVVSSTPADYANLWVVFKNEPKSIKGVVNIIEFVPGKDSDGNKIPVERSRCTTSAANNCIGYLKEKLNIPLSVFNTTSSLEINM